MDPNAALEIIRYQLMRWNEEAPNFDPDELAEQVDALDGWLSLGGFLPDDWTTLDNKRK